MADKTYTGLKKETAAALSYVLGPITGVIILLLEKDPYIRYHAMQSILFFGGVIVIQWVLGMTVIFSFMAPLISLVAFVFWLILIYKALEGKKWAAPLVSKYIEKLL